MINQKKQSRRDALKIGVAAITVAGATTLSSSASAQTKTPFKVKSTFIPIADSKYLSLNLTNAVGTDNDYFANTNPTSSVFSVGAASNTNRGSEGMIAYCFAEVKGFSKFGSYTGNGNADGTFVYTGFKPAFILVKNTTTAGNSWAMFDNKRLGYNVSNLALFPSDSSAETSGTSYIDILSNGFKMRSTNDFNNKSGDTYIYAAFAENPFCSSKGIPTTAR